jgi:hypothetical protein
MMMIRAKLTAVAIQSQRLCGAESNPSGPKDDDEDRGLDVVQSRQEDDQVDARRRDVGP